VDDDVIKDLTLYEELNNACKLIKAGFDSLQTISMEDDFYHLPHQLLASGLERLMKCYFCLAYKSKHKEYPNNDYLKKLGHDLTNLKKEFISNYNEEKNETIIDLDYDFMNNDKYLNKIINILSEFGKYNRYYNLNVVTGSQKPSSNSPDDEWQKLEMELISPSLDDMEYLIKECYPEINSKIISILERFLRGIYRLFIVGNSEFKSYSVCLRNFGRLRDEELGTTDYRRSVKTYSEDKWKKRNKKTVLRSKWPKRLIKKEEFIENFKEEWPFRADEIIIECREQLFCIVNIKDYDYALNGMTLSKFKYPDPHETGIAILGRSIGTFTDLALKLGEKSN